MGERQSKWAQPFLKSHSPFIREAGPAFGIILVALGLAFFTDQFLDFFHHEDFYLYHYANNYPYLEAIKLYLVRNARPLEEAYWAGTYKIFGYAPAVLHLMSFLLHFAGVFLATLIIYRAWPRQKNYYGAFFVFPLFLFFVPQATNWATYLSGDNARNSVLFFLISVALIQQWARSGLKSSWLILGLLSFVTAVFVYDVVIFLFPAALFFAWPSLPTKLQTKKTRLWFIAVALTGAILALVPFALYRSLEETTAGGITHPAFSKGFVTEIPIRIVQAVPLIFNALYRVGGTLELNSRVPEFLQFLPFGIVLGAGIWLCVNQLRLRKGKDREERNRTLILLSGSFWIIVLGLVPYLLSIQTERTFPRYYSAAIYGFAFIFFMAFFSFRRIAVRVLLGLVLVLIIFAGVWEFDLLSTRLRAFEAPLSHFYLSMLEAIPAVRERTVIFVIDPDARMSASGACALGLRMLYDVGDLKCAFLTYTDSRWWAEREADNILAHEGVWDNSENWIFVSVDPNGEKIIVPEITQFDGLLIDWISTEPIRTDYDRILFDKIPDSQMYLHLLERSQELEK